MAILKQYGYIDKSDPVYLESFDADEVVRIRRELDCKLKLVQLIGSDDWKESKTNYAEMLTEAGIKKVAEYADGIGPWLPHLIEESNSGEIEPSPLAACARAEKLTVHPFTYRADELPKHAKSFEELILFHRDKIKVDGFFTDQPDRVIRILADG